ncbi:Uncharacterised protein [Mycobacteroides abscessus subsp. abscessus]|nr:Uncharacterised protein [Mycobacteroides abscessus subsp. abscessus]
MACPYRYSFSIKDSRHIMRMDIIKIEGYKSGSFAGILRSIDGHAFN